MRRRLLRIALALFAVSAVVAFAATDQWSEGGGVVAATVVVYIALAAWMARATASNAPSWVGWVILVLGVTGALSWSTELPDVAAVVMVVACVAQAALAATALRQPVASEELPL